MAFKALIFLGLLAVALGYTLPDEQFTGLYEYAEPESEYAEQLAFADSDLVLVRRARSPQGSVYGSYGYEPTGRTATLGYNHAITKNLDVYAGAARNIDRNQNSGHAGLSYRF